MDYVSDQTIFLIDYYSTFTFSCEELVVEPISVAFNTFSVGTMSI